jgi:hypothetical protein
LQREVASRSFERSCLVGDPRSPCFGRAFFRERVGSPSRASEGALPAGWDARFDERCRRHRSGAGTAAVGARASMNAAGAIEAAQARRRGTRARP